MALDLAYGDTICKSRKPARSYPVVKQIIQKCSQVMGIRHRII